MTTAVVEMAANGKLRVRGLDAAAVAGLSTVARWHDGGKYWLLPLSYDAVAGLRSLGARLPSGVSSWQEQQRALAAQRQRANALKDTSVAELRQRMTAAGVRFRRPLFDHQVQAAAYALKLSACGLFMDTGTGKTATMSVVMQALADLRGYRRFLIMAPKSILDTSWAADVESFSWLRSVNISDPPARETIDTCPRCGKKFSGHVSWRHMRTHMSSAIDRLGEQGARDELFRRHAELAPPGSDDKRQRLLRALSRDDAQVFLINPESFRLVFDDLMSQKWDMFVVDESSCLKNPKSKITKMTLTFGSHVRRRVCASATPRPNSSLDFWGQIAFLDQALGGNFYSFREKYYYKSHDGYTWLPKSDSVDEDIRDIVFDRAIHFRLDDCVSLPGESFETRRVTLTKELRDAYRSMEKDMRLRLDSGEEVSTSWLVVKLNKLSQLTSGFIFDEDGREHWLDKDSPKIQETLRTARDLVDIEGRSVVIWVRYRQEAETLERELVDYGVSTMHGGTRDHRSSAEAFKSGANKVMIANPGSAKFGHTWVEHCNVAIFHSYDYSFENWYQARRRIYRIGQKRPVTYVTVVADGTVDEDIIDAVREKRDGHEAVVEGNMFLLMAAKVRSRRGR